MSESTSQQEAFRNGTYLFSQLDEVGEVDPMILAMATNFAGKKMALDKVTSKLARSFPGRHIYASTACTCGAPGCVNTWYGTVGYLEGYVDEQGTARGVMHHVLRLDSIDTDEKGGSTHGQV